MTLQRVQYREGQVLEAQDLADEQAYHLGMRRRHYIGQHGWGILAGLELRYERGRLVLEPGLAIDGYGRELIVSERQVLPPGALPDADNRQLLFWLRYARVLVAPSRARHVGTHTRWREEARLCYQRTAVGVEPFANDRRRPAEIAAEDWPFPPHRDPPDDPQRLWPVYLGRVVYQVGGDPQVNLSNRPYATLVGETVRSASATPVPEDPQNPTPTPLPPVPRAILFIGESQFGRHRFAIALPDAAGRLSERIASESDGSTILRGAATLATGFPAKDAPQSVSGRLFLGKSPPTPLEAQPGPASAFGAASSAGPEKAYRLRLRPLAEVTTTAQPWRIYRVDIERDGRRVQQLRIELPDPGEGDPSAMQWAVGTLVEKSATSNDENVYTFRPCLTVDAGCAVTIHGDLTAQGPLFLGPIQASPEDPRLLPALVDAWLRGAAAANNLSLEISDFNPRTPRSFYKLTVGNSGQETVELINFYERHRVNGGVFSRETQLPSIGGLGPGEKKEFFVAYDQDTLPRSGRINIVIRAIGRGRGNLFYGEVEAQHQWPPPSE